MKIIILLNLSFPKKLFQVAIRRKKKPFLGFFVKLMRIMGFKNNPQGLVPWGTVLGEIDKKTTKTFGEMMDFIKSKGYDVVQTWDTTAEQDKKAINYLDTRVPLQNYKAGFVDCVTLVTGAMLAALGADSKIWKERNTNMQGRPRRTRSCQRTYNYFYLNNGTGSPVEVTDGLGRRNAYVLNSIETQLNDIGDFFN